MAKNTNQYELALSVFYYRNPIFLNNLLGCKLSQMEIEKRYNNRTVDMYAVDHINKAEVFVEYQITPSDTVHLEQVKSIIQSNWSSEYSKIIWIATTFKNEYLEQIQKLIMNTNKRIEFYACILNEDVLTKLKLLNLNNKYEDKDEIDNLNEIADHLKTVCRYRTDELRQLSSIESRHINFKKQLLEQIINEMRVQMAWYLPVFLSKSVQGNRFSLGSGVSDVTYVVGINRHNALYVQVTFSKNRLKLYKKVKGYREEIDNELDYRTYWDDVNRRINTTYLLQGHVENNVKETARLLEKYVRCFNKYI